MLSGWMMGAWWLLPMIWLGGVIAIVFTKRWRWALQLSYVETALALVLWLLSLWQVLIPHQLWLLQPWHTTLFLFISFLGLVLIQFGSNIFEDVPRDQRCLKILLLSKFVLGVFILSDNLAIIWLAWVGLGLAQEQLTRHYISPNSLFHPHEKLFLFNRAAELCLLMAILGLHHSVQSWSVWEVVQLFGQTSAPFWVSLSTGFLILAVLLRSAQVPFHGWLVQSCGMPLPILAWQQAMLLSSGPWLLFLFSPLLFANGWLQMVVALFAGFSLIIATGAVLSQPQLRRRLAWSASAQLALALGFIAAGLTSFALIQFIAFMTYHTHACLTVNQTVKRHTQREMTRRPLSCLGYGLIVGCLSFILINAGFWWLMPVPTYTGSLLFGVALSIALTDQWYFAKGRHYFYRLGSVLLTGVVYLALLWLMPILLPSAMLGWFSPGIDAWIGGCLLICGMGTWALKALASQEQVLMIKQVLSQAFYLDHWVTAVFKRCPFPLKRKKG